MIRSSVVQLHVAVVDDEKGVRDAVAYALRQADFAVTKYVDGAAALDAWHAGLPDIVVLDIIMPRLDGIELCRRIRQRSELTPVIFLTSKDDEIDRIVGLELGADDYLCKPFSVRELVARVKALSRRLRMPDRNSDDGDALHCGELTLDRSALRVTYNGTPVPLTVTEFRILETLVRNEGAVLSRAQLLEAAYPDDVYVTDRSIDSHIRRTRRKFEEVGFQLDQLSSVYGAGYRFVSGVPG
jgi:two-component system response regulator ChvI